jgi:hypothetical protein
MMGSTVDAVWAADAERKKRHDLPLALTADWAVRRNPYNYGWITKLVERAVDPDRVVEVDVAGGLGYGLQAIIKANPSIPHERFVLQDRADLLEKARLRNDRDLMDVKLVVCHPLEEQPVKSRFFFFLPTPFSLLNFRY